MATGKWALSDKVLNVTRISSRFHPCRWIAAVLAALHCAVPWCLKTNHGRKEAEYHWQRYISLHTSLSVAVPFLINTLSSPCLALTFLFKFCAVWFFCPVLHVQLIFLSFFFFIVRISAFVPFFLLSESSPVFLQSSSVPAHPFLPVSLSLGLCVWFGEMRSTCASSNTHQLVPTKKPCVPLSANPQLELSWSGQGNAVWSCSWLLLSY